MILITGIVLVGVVSIPLFAHGPGWGGDRRGHGYGDCPYYEYEGKNLTQEQRAELDTLRNEHRANTAKIRDQLIDKKYNMRSELSKTDPDVKKVKTLQAEISGLRGEMDNARIEHALKVKKVDPDARVGYFSRGGRHKGAGCGRGFRGTGPGGAF